MNSGEIPDNKMNFAKRKLRAWGGVTKRNPRKGKKLAFRKENPPPTTMCDWDGWLGPEETSGDRMGEK